MLKNIALAGIFAVVSVVSFSSAPVKAAAKSSSPTIVQPIRSPEMKGICAALGRTC